jgi:hypothetical protein
MNGRRPLYDEAERNDSALQAEEKALRSASGGEIDELTLASISDREFMAVAPESWPASLSASSESASW